MIERIVKMQFRPDCTEDFVNIFQASKHQIAAFKGCQGLKLLRDIKHKNIFFTYSYWESEDALNAYRDSDLFEVTWRNTKALFSDKAQAWSLSCEEKVK